MEEGQNRPTVATPGVFPWLRYPCELALDDGEDDDCELDDTDLLDDELDRLTSTVLDDDSLDADFDELLDVEPLDELLPDDVLALLLELVIVCVLLLDVLAVLADVIELLDVLTLDDEDQDASAVLLLDVEDELSSNSSTHQTRKPDIKGDGPTGGVTTAGNSRVAIADTCPSSAASWSIQRSNWPFVAVTSALTAVPASD